MGSGKHQYRIQGKRREISPTFGWIIVEQIEHHAPNSDKPDAYPLFDPGRVQAILGSEPILEYFLVENSPNPEHPADLGLMSHMNLAEWNSTFDLLVIVQATTEGNLEALEKHGAVWSDEPVSPEQIKHFVRALLTPDKTKFKREADS